MNYCSYLVFKKSLHLRLFIEVFIFKLNKQRQIYRNISTVFLKPNDICACAMPSVEKGHQQNFPSRSKNQR